MGKFDHIDKFVSVIIPTTDKEKAVLEKCVNAIKESTYKNVEIIVVNEGKERSIQRNIGISRAKGNYLLILDSDQIVSPCLIEECVKSVYGAIYIPEKIITKGWFGYLRNWERQFYTGTPIDVVRFVEKKHCPNFDETMSGPEDSDWDRRIRLYRTVTKNCLYHLDNVGVFDYFKKKAYYTKSMKRFEEKWPGDKCLDFKYRCFGVFLENGKWKRFFASPHLALGVMMIVLIRGIIYLCLKKS